MFGDDWTPAHLTGGKTNLYKEIAFALKGAEWRQPGLVAVASKIAASAGEHKPIDVNVPDSYVPKRGPNKWKDGKAGEIQAMIKRFDFDSDFIISVNELHQLLSRTDPELTFNDAGRIYDQLLEKADASNDGQISIDEVAAYRVLHHVTPIGDVGAEDESTTMPTEPVQGKLDKFPPVQLEMIHLASEKGKTKQDPPKALGVPPPQAVPPLQAAPTLSSGQDLSDRIKDLFMPGLSPTAAPAAGATNQLDA